jgi:hypothetical protein
LALLSECAYWARDGVQWEEHRSDAASFGTELHGMAEAFIEARVQPPVPSAVADVFDRMLLPWLRANKRAGWRAEVPFAIDIAAGFARELEKGEHREYKGAKPGDLCMTTDIVYMGEDEEGPFGCVDDIKWSGFHGDYQKARDQLRGQALAIHLAWGVDRVRARAIRVDSARVDDTTEAYWFDCFDLAEALDELRTQVANIEHAQPIEGDHCRGRHCPALASCPKTAVIVEQVIPADALARTEWRFTPQIESPDHLQRVHAMLPIAKEYIERVSAAVKAYVADGAITTSDGTVIQQSYRTMPRLDTDDLIKLAKAKGATDEEISACVHAKVEGNGVRASKPKKGRKAA